MFKYELLKSKRQWTMTAVVTIALLAYYLSTAFFGNFDTFSGINKQYFLTHQDYQERERSEETAVVNEALYEQRQAEYRKLVDENCLTPEQSREQLTSVFGETLPFTAEEALNNRYNIEYGIGVLPIDLFNSMTEKYAIFFNTIYPLAQDPVAYLKESESKADKWAMEAYGVSSLEASGYSKVQVEDYRNFVEQQYDNLELVTGYSFGWDILTTVMQFLPYTLGIAILVALSNLFAQERSLAVAPILQTTKFGRRKLLRRKLSFALLIAAGLWILFQAAMLITVAIAYGLDGASVTVLSFLYEPSLFGLNWGTYYLIQSLFSFCGTMVFALFICCLSSLLPLKVCLTFGLVSTIVTGIPLTNFNDTDAAFTLLNKLQALTPAQLMGAYPTLQIYQSYSIGNFQLLLPYAMAIAIVVETAFMLFFLYRREGGK